jgi:hypothetical protein
MVLEVATNAGDIGYGGDVLFGQQGRVTDPRQLKDLGSMNCSGCEDGFL